MAARVPRHRAPQLKRRAFLRYRLSYLVQNFQISVTMGRGLRSAMLTAPSPLHRQQKQVETQPVACRSWHSLHPSGPISLLKWIYQHTKEPSRKLFPWLCLGIRGVVTRAMLCMGMSTQGPDSSEAGRKRGAIQFDYRMTGADQRC